MRSETSELVFRFWTDTSDRRYPQTFLRIWKTYREEVSAVREGAIDNKDGYGSPDGATYWLNAASTLTDGGHEVVYRSSCSYGPDVTIRWQHYNETEFCAANFEHNGRGFSEIKMAMELLAKVGRVVEKMSLAERKKEWEHASLREVSSRTFDDPHALGAALRKMKIVEVESMRVGPDSWHTVDVPKKARPVEYTLTDADSAGMAVSA